MKARYVKLQIPSTPIIFKRDAKIFRQKISEQCGLEITPL
jgi:hypothetical protein